MPRRSRRSKPGRPSLPLIPILLAVVVVGLAVGAGLSVLTQRGGKAPVALVTAAPPASPSPTPAASKAPLALKSPAARRTHAPPTPRATASPTPRATSSSTPHARVRAIVASPLAIVITPPPAPRSTPLIITPTAPAARAPIATRVITPPPPTIPPYAMSQTSPHPATAPTDEADSDFARLSAGVVRFYLSALQRGDDASAMSALDPAHPRTLSEKSFIDATLHIGKLDAHGTGDSATVEVDLTTSRGAYFEQFTLRRLPSGAGVISEHTFIRP